MSVSRRETYTHTNCIDLLRFLFSLMVVIHHWIDVTMVQLPPMWMRLQSELTTFSILGFFILSGNLITQSYDRDSNLKHYFSKRARRLLPPYILMIFVCAFGLSAVSTLPPTAYFFSRDWWKYLGANLCFLNFLHPTLPGVFENAFVNDASVNPALWTLKIEVSFYLILPLLWIGFKRMKRSWIGYSVLYILSVIYLAKVNYQLPGMLCYFASGMMVYQYKELFLAYRHKLIIPAVAIYLAEAYLGFVLLSPLALGIIVMCAAFSLPRLNNIVCWGDISYGMYVYHAPILKVLATLGLFVTVATPWAVLIYITIVVLISLASWHLMEKKILHKKLR